VSLFGGPEGKDWDYIINKFFKIEIDEITLTNKPGLECVNSRWGTFRKWIIEDGMNNTVLWDNKESVAYPLINVTFFVHETEVLHKFVKLIENYDFGTYELIDSVLEETILVLQESSER